MRAAYLGKKPHAVPRRPGCRMRAQPFREERQHAHPDAVQDRRCRRAWGEGMGSSPGLYDDDVKWLFAPTYTYIRQAAPFQLKPVAVGMPSRPWLDRAWGRGRLRLQADSPA